MIDLHLLRLENIPILEQLAIEEALLRTDHRNICIVNSGTPPAIVMGISGKAESFSRRKGVEQVSRSDHQEVQRRRHSLRQIPRRCLSHGYSIAAISVWTDAPKPSTSGRRRCIKRRFRSLI